ncbi:rod-binding protein [uncultured Roseovarius sp.]|uniref:rod-binding protein n=1 Tax=uncultured Roseovarius sp. TaxID=293344 RepID=UPI00338E611F
MTDFLPIPPPGPKITTQLRDSTAMAAARKLEASFLAEMLKSTGLGEQKNSFSGSAGEDQFASFHRQAIADRMVESGGIGLAEMFCKSMMEKSDD